METDKKTSNQIRMERYHSDPAYKKHINELSVKYQKNRYRNNPAYREYRKALSRAYHEEHKEERKRKQKEYRDL